MKVARIINFLEFRDNRRRTRDDKYTQGELIDNINSIIDGLNTTSCDNRQLTDYIVKCFSINGLLETYNQLGYDGWRYMIIQMVEHEIYERSVGNGI